MDIFSITRSVVSTGAGIGAGIIARQAIQTVAPITTDAKKLLRAVHFLGRLSVVGIVMTAAEEHMKAEFDKAKEQITEISVVAQDVKQTQTLAKLAKQMQDKSEKQED